MSPVFGRVLTAMVTPLHPTDQRSTTRRWRGWPPTWSTTSATTGSSSTAPRASRPPPPTRRSARMLDAVVTAVGDRASIVAGVGTFSTHHTIELARQAADVGVDGLLVVTPYYSRPPADALEDHFVSVADATDLPDHALRHSPPHRNRHPGGPADRAGASTPTSGRSRTPRVMWPPVPLCWPTPNWPTTPATTPCCCRCWRSAASASSAPPPTSPPPRCARSSTTSSQGAARRPCSPTGTRCRPSRACSPRRAA